MKVKVTTSSVEVYKVLGETMEIAFNNLKQEHKLDNYNLKKVSSNFDEDAINNGKIYKHSEYLYSQYLRGEESEYAVFGALYNKKPVVGDSSRVVMHNIVIRGTKQWETVNSYRFDSGSAIFEDTETKANSMEKAKELALEYNKTINIVVSKRLKDMDGILGIAEFLPLDCIDDSNVYVFWVYSVKVDEVDEDDLADENTIQDACGQLSIKEDMFSYYGRQVINKD